MLCCAHCSPLTPACMILLDGALLVTCRAAGRNVAYDWWRPLPEAAAAGQNLESTCEELGLTQYMTTGEVSPSQQEQGGVGRWEADGQVARRCTRLRALIN